MDGIKFEAYKARRLSSDLPQISIMGNGSFGLGKAFLEHFKLWRMRYVAFRFADTPDLFLIGFSFSEKDDMAGSLKLYIPKTNSMHATVTALSFFKQRKIDYPRYLARYDVEKIEDADFGTLFVIKLQKKEVVKKGDNF